MKAVPIPGQILRDDVFLGLSFDELILLGAIPLVVVFPTLYVEQIPLVVSLSLILVAAIGVVAVVIQTPEGQTPTEWAPNAFRRRIMPTEYYLKPREPRRAESEYLDRVQTAEAIVAADERANAQTDADIGDERSTSAAPTEGGPTERERGETDAV